MVILRQIGDDVLQTNLYCRLYKATHLELSDV